MLFIDTITDLWYNHDKEYCLHARKGEIVIKAKYVCAILLVACLCVVFFSFRSPKLIAYSDYGTKIGPEVVVIAELPSVEKYELKSVPAIKIGVGNGSRHFQRGELTIGATNFMIEVFEGASAETELVLEYFDFNTGTKHYPKYDCERTSEGNSCKYYERVYFQYVGEGPSSGVISVSLYGATEDLQQYSGDRVAFYYATDGEYIAFSVESEKKAQAALKK